VLSSALSAGTVSAAAAADGCTAAAQQVKPQMICSHLVTVLFPVICLQALSSQQQQLSLRLQQVEQQLAQCAEARVELVVLRGQVRGAFLAVHIL
jgi:hypothetical protein